MNTDTPEPTEVTPEPETVTPDQPIPTIKLGKEFDVALMGADIRGRFVYSLTQLTAVAMQQMPLTLDQAKQYIGHQAVHISQTHGMEAPIFVDDELVASVAQRGIITPTEEDIEKVIAIPGQNHGAVKGFLAPGELTRG